MNRPQKLKLATSLYCLLLAVFLYFFNRHLCFNADSAIGVFESMDWSKGNFLLKNWDLSELNFYFSETVPKGFLLWAGFSPLTICYLAPAIYWALVVYLAADLVLQKSESWVAFIFIISCLSLPSLWFAVHIISNDNIHIGCLIAALWLMNLIKKQPTFLRAFFLAFFVSLMIFSDPLIVGFFCLPFFIIAGAGWFLKYYKISEFPFPSSSLWQSWFWIIFAGILGNFFEHFCLSFTNHWHQDLQTHLEGISSWGHELVLSSSGALGFFTELPRHFNVQSVSVFVVFILFFPLSCFYVWKGSSKKSFLTDFQDLILFCGFLAGFALATLKMRETDYHIRYALPALVFMLIFIGRNLSLGADKKGTCLIIGASFLFLALHFKEDVAFCLTSKIPDYQHIAHIITKHQEKNCFSEYEAGSNLMLRIPEIDTFAAIEYRQDGKFHANQFLAKRDWYSAPRHCYISHKFSDIEKIRLAYRHNSSILEETEGYYLLFFKEEIHLAEPLFK